jgi:hypothetical protein
MLPQPRQADSPASTGETTTPDAEAQALADADLRDEAQPPAAAPQPEPIRARSGRIDLRRNPPAKLDPGATPTIEIAPSQVTPAQLVPSGVARPPQSRLPGARPTPAEAPRAETAPQTEASEPLSITMVLETPTDAPEAKATKAPASNAKTPKGKTSKEGSDRSQIAPRQGRFAYLFATVGAVLWIAGIGSWAAYQSGLGELLTTPLNLGTLGLLALAPVCLMFTAAYLGRQGSRLAAETWRARTLSEAMVAPAALASEQTVLAVHAMRSEIDAAVAVAERARGELTALREALAEETRELNAAADQAARTAATLKDTLGVEREEMTKLSEILDRQAAGVMEAVDRQARMVADASDLAQAQLNEAQAALAARAADLAAASGEAQDAARLASDDLARQTIRLETAGAGVAEQIRSVEEGLSQQRGALVTAAYALRSEQEDFSAQVETQRAQLIEALGHTRLAAADLSDASSKSAETLRDLVQLAAEQFKTLSETTHHERDVFEADSREAIEHLRALAAETRDVLVEEANRGLEALQASAAEARRLAEESVDAAQQRIERLGEAAFDAGKRADQTFEASTTQAQRLIEQSASLIEEAGDRAGARLETNLAVIRQSLAEVDSAIVEIDGRAARLPQEARDRIEDIRVSVEQGLEALAAAARKAAEETQAVDAAFQDRVKRNYDMLAEAVKLMTVVNGGVAAAPRTAAPESREARAPAREPRREPARQAARAPEPQPQPAPEHETAGAAAGLRPRLKLTPTAGDQELKQAFEPGEGRPADGWTWRDLLNGMDNRGEEPPAAPPESIDDEALADRLIDEIGSLGVDPNALLPRTRIEEAASAYQRGDYDAARLVVRRVAPAAVRRISRRILTEPALRIDADRFVGRYETLLDEAARQDHEGYRAAALLNSDPGRAFLLIDAAIGDLN